MKAGQRLPFVFSTLSFGVRRRIWRQRDVDHHSRFFKNVLLSRTANGDAKGKVFFNGCRRILNCQGSPRLRLAVGRIERKLRLSCIWRELSPPTSVGIKTLGKFAAPGGVLLYLRGEEQGSLGMIDACRAQIHALPYGNIRGIFPSGRTDRKG